MNDSAKIPGPAAQKKIRILFLILIPYLFIQFFFAKYVEEPYPGFLFPLFGGVNGKDGVYPTPAEEVYIFAGTDTLSSSKQEIFGMANESYRYYLMRDYLGPETPPEITGRKDYRDFMRSRLQEVTGRSDVSGVWVVWKMKYFDSNVSPVKITTETTGEFTLTFEDPGS